MTTANTPPSISVAEAKRRVRQELDAYRERHRLERKAQAAADQTADEEVEITIRRRRDEEAQQAERRTGYA